MNTTNSRSQILATVAALFLGLQGSAWASRFCCQTSDGCFNGFHHDLCERANGQEVGGHCDRHTGLCGSMPVCCDEGQGSCSEITADQCADGDGTAIAGDHCDANGACRTCQPEGACPIGNVLVDAGPVKVNLGDVYNPGACCGTATCKLLGVGDVPCELALVDPVITCTCNPYGYADAASLTAPPSNAFAMLFGAGAVGLLLPVRRRRRAE
jgi:hypothetical protein